MTSQQTASWLGLRNVYQARHKGSHLLLDVSDPSKDGYCVCVTYKGVAIWRIVKLSLEAAIDWFETALLADGPEGCGDWRVVLDRLRGREQPAGVWEGSPAEYAARFFNVGTWEWVHTLTLIRENDRQRQQEGKGYNLDKYQQEQGGHLRLYEDLLPEQQRRAVALTFERIVIAVTECGLRFDDDHNGNQLQAKIDAAQFNEAGYELPLEDWQRAVRLLCEQEIMPLAEEAARTAVFTEGETLIQVGDL